MWLGSTRCHGWVRSGGFSLTRLPFISSETITLFFHADLYATVIHYSDLWWHTCEPQCSLLMAHTYRWQQYAAVTLAICYICLYSYFIQTTRDVRGLWEHMVGVFFHILFIFSHRVILQLQREHKDSYCVLS